VLAGLIGPGRVARVLDLPVVVLLALIEGIVAESEHGAKTIDDAYDEARPTPPPPPRKRGPERRAEIDRFANL
jgi:hypothetical protein